MARSVRPVLGFSIHAHNRLQHQWEYKMIMHSKMILTTAFLASLSAGHEAKAGSIESLAASAALHPMSATSGDHLVLTPDMTYPPKWKEVEDNGGLFSGYYRVVSCTKYANSDRSDAGVSIAWFNLPVLDLEKIYTNRATYLFNGSYERDRNLILVVQNQDSWSMNQWQDWTISAGRLTKFYTQNDASTRDQVEYIDNGDEIAIKMKSQIVQLHSGEAEIGIKKTASGFQLTTDMVDTRAGKYGGLVAEYITESCELRQVKENPTLEGRYIRIPAGQ